MNEVVFCVSIWSGVAMSAKFVCSVSNMMPGQETAWGLWPLRIGQSCMASIVVGLEPFLLPRTHVLSMTLDMPMQHFLPWGVNLVWGIPILLVGSLRVRFHFWNEYTVCYLGRWWQMIGLTSLCPLVFGMSLQLRIDQRASWWIGKISFLGMGIMVFTFDRRVVASTCFV